MCETGLNRISVKMLKILIVHKIVHTAQS